MINPQRIRQLNKFENGEGPVIYWMSRDQRVNDNWAMLYAQSLSFKLKKPLIVVFNLVPKFLGATMRQYSFMLRGLEELSAELKKYKIPFVLLKGDPSEEVPKFASKTNPAAIISDFSPLKINKEWKKQVLKKINVPFYEVDAHNVVPCWIASPKLEYGAYTIRPKIHRLLDVFLDEFPKLKKQAWPKGFTVNKLKYEDLKNFTNVDESVSEVDWILPGEKMAKNALEYFLDSAFNRYSIERNDPNKDAQSNLSPYLHFGHISAQRIAMETIKEKKYGENRKAFLEELIVRRELADNFCYYNSKYDSIKSFPNWALKTLNEHRSDKRSHLYTKKKFEYAKTHDDLWNAAQTEMVKKGKMHGYMRMYWAKKILEWTKTPEEAMNIAIYLNDKYELDGRDPNGYAGIAWSIGGVHDRAWNSREVFGKIRYMSYKGCKSKFDIKNYIRKHHN